MANQTLGSIKIKTRISDVFVSWIRGELGNLPVIVAQTNKKRPSTLPYLSINLITPLEKVGRDDSKQYNPPDPQLPIDDDNPDDAWIISGQREFTMSISAYSKNGREHFYEAQDLLTQLTDAIEDPVRRAPLTAVGLAVRDTGAILNLSELLETGYEPRAQMDLMMNIASNRLARLGAIEKVEVQGTVDDEQDKKFDIDLTE